MGYQLVEINGEQVEFPDTMSDADIEKAIKSSLGFTKTPVNLQEVANRPEDYTINPKLVALGGLAGSLIGGVGAKLAKTGGSALVGALEGGISGTVASGTGEIIREATNNSNVGQLTALGAELVSGAVLPLARDVITRIPPAGLMAAVGYAKAKTAQAILGESESSRIAKNAIFGKETISPGVATTNYREQFDKTANLELANSLGLQVPEGKLAQDIIRNNMLDEIALKGASGQTFKNTPIYSDLMRKLSQGVKDGVVKAEDVKAIANLLNSQSSINPKTMASFSERLLNTAQQATKEYNGVKISDDAADMLKESIDNYLGKPVYAGLKKLEKDRFTAKAMDDIPVLLDKGFSGEQVENALANLSKNPYGKDNFKVALSSYMRSLPEKEALKEWNRLYESGILTKTKVMDLGDIYSFNRKVKKYTEKGYINKAGDITGHALKMGIVQGILPAEISNRADALSPFKM